MITKAKFLEFETLRQSGKCNMFHISCVQSYIDLSLEEIKEIMRHYAEYKERWYK